jgi:hypothetical protein
MLSKLCERCNEHFYCQPENIMACQCYCVQLSDATRSFLEQSFFDCLCQKCLIEIDKKIQTLPSNDNLIENQHFYYEGNYMVFTEQYLMSRGYCCKSSCRHCPYGFVRK